MIKLLPWITIACAILAAVIIYKGIKANDYSDRGKNEGIDEHSPENLDYKEVMKRLKNQNNVN